MSAAGGVAAVVVTIGRNVGDVPMPAPEWARFRRQIASVLRDADADVHTAATGTGRWIEE